MAISENNCGFFWYDYCKGGLAGARRAAEGLGSLGRLVGLFCGERVEEKKSLNLTNFIPNGLRIIQIFTKSFRRPKSTNI